MKRILLTTLALVAFAGAAVAQPQLGMVGIFSDVAGTDCNIADAGGLIGLEIVHTGQTGATGSQFKIELGAGVNWVFVADSEVGSNLVIGDSQNGISVAYGVCAPSPWKCYRALYSSPGAAPACSYASIVPSPLSLTGLVEIIDCSSLKHTYDVGGQAIINSDGSCDCNVPVEETNWGRVKALYQN
jgi:hypothetical protein